MRDISGIVVSLAAFDGHPFETAVDTAAELGIDSIEPAVIAGYTDPFDEDVFRPGLAHDMRVRAKEVGLDCRAFSAHIDIGGPEGEEKCARRIEFAAELGAQRLVTNAALLQYERDFFDRIDRLARRAEQADVLLCLENPGDGKPNLIDNAAAASEFMRAYDNPWIRLNYDPGNLVTHQPFLAPHRDAVHLGPGLVSMHIKDAYFDGERWRFTALGAGVIDYSTILAHTDALSPSPSYSLEIPLRVSRAPDGKPSREPTPIPLELIKATLEESLEWIRTH